MKHILNCKIIYLFSCLFMVGGSFAVAPISVLIMTGQNNHNWPVSSQALKEIMESSGLFEVDMAISPVAGEDMDTFIVDFDPYQLIVLDCNGDSWPEVTKERFLRFVNDGGGVIVYHAANNAFPDWVDYNELCGLGGWEGRNELSGLYWYWEHGQLVPDTLPGPGGSHGHQHVYELTCRTTNHPITQGLPKKWLHATDELYDRMRGPGNISALLYTAWSNPETGGSGREELLIFTVQYGNGRVFHTMLGHAGPSIEENPAMECPGFQTLFLRGAEWAATGQVTQPVPFNFPAIQ